MNLAQLSLMIPCSDAQQNYLFGKLRRERVYGKGGLGFPIPCMFVHYVELKGMKGISVTLLLLMGSELQCLLCCLVSILGFKHVFGRKALVMSAYGFLMVLSHFPGLYFPKHLFL